MLLTQSAWYQELQHLSTLQLPACEEYFLSKRAQCNYHRDKFYSLFHNILKAKNSQGLDLGNLKLKIWYFLLCIKSQKHILPEILTWYKCLFWGLYLSHILPRRGDWPHWGCWVWSLSVLEMSACFLQRDSTLVSLLMRDDVSTTLMVIMDVFSADAYEDVW